MRAALYVRVSTEDQAREGFSLDAQMKKLELYCKARGWTVADMFIDDGYSGRDIKRPEYSRMMLSMDEWDVLLVMKMDRIHRNSVNFAEMMNHLKKNGKEFNSFQEKFDTTTAMGRFVMDIMQRIAQLESEQIGERVKMGMEHKARSCSGALGSGHPFGYVYNNGTLEVVPDEASTVRMIYELRSQGSSTEGIAKALNEASIPAKKGGMWNRQSVHRILRNPLYTGKMRWDGVTRDSTHIPIIEGPLSDDIQGGQYV
ncbi:MAG: recombinase family protein [Methanomassiliicoccaceae archaeon]|jgi:DNA invertase Pin-like site-specific DNA recombinase|nr:recombinase family protein [Methanomassiliicoccaceae archaeon]